MLVGGTQQRAGKPRAEQGSLQSTNPVFSTDLLQERGTGEEQSRAGPGGEIPPLALLGNIPMVFPGPGLGLPRCRFVLVSHIPWRTLVIQRLPGGILFFGVINGCNSGIPSWEFHLQPQTIAPRAEAPWAVSMSRICRKNPGRAWGWHGNVRKKGSSHRENPSKLIPK